VPFDNQQARVVAFRGWFLGNQVFREFIIEIGDEHNVTSSASI
jgi:hypothetical protein